MRIGDIVGPFIDYLKDKTDGLFSGCFGQKINFIFEVLVQR